MRPGRLIALVSAAGALLATAPVAALAAPPQLAAVGSALKAASAYIDPALKPTPAATAALLAAQRNASTHNIDLRLGSLSAIPTGAATKKAAAKAIRTAIGDKKANVILAFPDGSIATSTTTVGGKRLARALAAASGTSGGAALIAFANSLAPPPPTTTATTSTSTSPAAKGGGSGVPIWVWIAAAAGVLLLVLILLRMNARRKPAQRRSGLIASAHQLVQDRTAALGRQLAETAGTIADRDDAGVAEHHRRASELVANVRASLPELDGPPAFRHAHESLDQAEWNLGVAMAHIDGTAEPPSPQPGKPARCFFDVNHGLATVELELELPGIRTVPIGVCAADAVQLSRGEDAVVGFVSVGRRTLPWAAAPIWFGGWGWGDDDLPSLRYDGRPVFASALTLEHPSSGSPAKAKRAKRVGGRRQRPGTPVEQDHDDSLAVDHDDLAPDLRDDLVSDPPAGPAPDDEHVPLHRFELHPEDEFALGHEEHPGEATVDNEPLIGPADPPPDPPDAPDAPVQKPPDETDDSAHQHPHDPP